MRAYLLVSILLSYLPASSQGRFGRIAVIRYSATVDQPAYVGEPIWVHTEPSGKIRIHSRQESEISAAIDWNCCMTARLFLPGNWQSGVIQAVFCAAGWPRQILQRTGFRFTSGSRRCHPVNMPFAEPGVKMPATSLLVEP
jgi:hypothetical protein